MDCSYAVKLQAHNLPDPHKDTKVRSLVIFYTLLLSKSSPLSAALCQQQSAGHAGHSDHKFGEPSRARNSRGRHGIQGHTGKCCRLFCPSHLSRAVCVYIVRPCMRDIYLILREEKCGRQIRTATQSFRSPVPREFMHSPH